MRARAEALRQQYERLRAPLIVRAIQRRAPERERPALGVAVRVGDVQRAALKIDAPAAPALQNRRARLAMRSSQRGRGCRAALYRGRSMSGATRVMRPACSRARSAACAKRRSSTMSSGARSRTRALAGSPNSTRREYRLRAVPAPAHAELGETQVEACLRPHQTLEGCALLGHARGGKLVSRAP